MTHDQMVILFLILLGLLCVDLRLILWSMERSQYVLKPRKILNWRQRARITFLYRIGVK